LGDEIKPNEVGGHVACLKEKKQIHRFRWKSLRERDQVEDLRIDGRIISIQILKKYEGWGDMDWIDLA
jgi:hypothetical protein